MKTLIFTGDSHTCGEYAEGYSASDISLGYDPKGLGVCRSIPLDACGYTSLVHKYLCKATASSVIELNAAQIASAYKLDVFQDNAVVSNSITLQSDCDCIQIMLGVTQVPTEIRVLIDGEEQKFSLYTPHPRYGKWSFKWLSFNCNKLTLIPRDEAYISFVRYCSGEWTCINSGVGSCTSEYFAQSFIPYNVEPFKADVIIAEAHTINDWLSGCTPNQYYGRLISLLNKLKDHTEMLYLMTVSPILGEQALPFNQYDYSLFVKASRDAAVRCNVPIIDANKAIENILSGLDDKARQSYYHDNWHLKNEGHRVYADAIINELNKIII